MNEVFKGIVADFEEVGRQNRPYSFVETCWQMERELRETGAIRILNPDFIEPRFMDNLHKFQDPPF